MKNKTFAIVIACAAGGAIGAGIGSIWTSPEAIIIGLVSGGILGWVNYKIVSIKILKLKPVH